MKYILPFSIFILFSCNTHDQKMCDCLDASEELNKFSAKMLTKEASEKDIAEMKKLRTTKSKKCFEYQVMSGKEMLKRKAECEE